MENQMDNNFTWVIKNFTDLPSNKIYSDEFVVGGCRWRLLAYPKGNNKPDHFSLFVDVVDPELLPLGWRRHAKVFLTIVNQYSDKLSLVREAKQHWFGENLSNWGFQDMITRTKLHAGEGFMVNGEVIVAVNVKVLEVEGQLDVSEETSPAMETTYVNGFQLLPSQVQSVNRLFERHQDIAKEIRTKNPYLRTGYMTVLLSLTESLSQSPTEISKGDLADQYAALAYLKDAGFELGWLEKKLDEVKEKKEKAEDCLARLQEMEEQINPLKRKYTDMEAQIDKVRAELLAAGAPVSLYDDKAV
ncbi:unnamed protein product [Microthlaspi erraticum]|uniref:MATH domain-containing protein n=1 Tax=Microthlaspi erraticum TaxID=1685480 RepID=A0A6D2K5G9_9BRAS|nr:unnamed protein product [Microthlaspi erraticum]